MVRRQGCIRRCCPATVETKRKTAVELPATAWRAALDDRVRDRARSRTAARRDGELGRRRAVGVLREPLNLAVHVHADQGFVCRRPQGQSPHRLGLEVHLLRSARGSAGTEKLRTPVVLPPAAKSEQRRRGSHWRASSVDHSHRAHNSAAQRPQGGLPHLQGKWGRCGLGAGGGRRRPGYDARTRSHGERKTDAQPGDQQQPKTLR